MTADALLQAARAASRNAYAPYSGFAVGAAILLDTGEIVTGCNVENASYGVTLCAETVALGTVVAQGKLKAVRAIAIVGGPIGADGIAGHDPIRPCGRCRQVIFEAAQVAGIDLAVHCSSGDGTVVEHHTIGALLPHAFGPADLDGEPR